MSKNISKSKTRVVVAMSGGVDSSVVAYLLKKEGYDVVGMFLKLWGPGIIKQENNKARKQEKEYSCSIKTPKQNLCCDDKAMAVARGIADKLKIPFYVLKVDNLFKETIVDNFVGEYDKGRTPNPCVRCNRYIKFGYLWNKAKEIKADYLATGHYIRKVQSSKFKIQKYGAPSAQIYRSKDKVKDQTYFLSTIKADVIPHLLFPIGSMTKKEVRAIAKRAGLPVYSKKDSVGVCFIPDGDHISFLSTFGLRLKQPACLRSQGDIVDKYGHVLGLHSGLLGYTVGQRGGISSGVAKQYFKFKILNLKSKISKNTPRLYVIQIDVKKNHLVVGEDKDCFKETLIAENVNILNNEFWGLVKKEKAMYAQIRGGHKAEKCKIVLVGADPRVCPDTGEHPPIRRTGIGSPVRLEVKFEKPVRAVTSGQAVAFYDKKGILLGGGTIK